MTSNCKDIIKSLKDTNLTKKRRKRLQKEYERCRCAKNEV